MRAAGLLLLAGCGGPFYAPEPILPPAGWEIVEPIGERTATGEALAAPEPARPEPYRPHRVLMRGAFQLFQRHFSPYDGSRCPFCPTCSEYGRLAVERHGFLRGSVLAAGRLQRCNPGAAGAYPRLIVGGNDFYPLHDPVPE